MPLKVIGAGVGRTSTASLKEALEILLGNPCHHMFEVMKRPEDLPVWHQAALGEKVDWGRLFDGYVAAVDWPTAAYWRELSQEFPDAIVVLSTRDPEKWWASASETIFQSIMKPDEEGLDRRLMIRAMLARTFTMDLSNKDACITAFFAHNEEVRRTVPADRLVEWSAEQGWEPLCKALNLPVPEQSFPRTNSKEEFRAKVLKVETETVR